MIPLQSHASPSAVTGKANWPCTTFVGIAQQTAVNRLNEWIRTRPEGWNNACLPTGIEPFIADGTRPQQVQLMINVVRGVLLRTVSPLFT